MARKLRLEYPGAIYHVMNRGNRGEEVFNTDEDRDLFVATLGEACGKTGWQIHAYCLMPNHFHAVVETPQPNLVAGMKWWLGTYTNRFNRRHRKYGHLFAGRYKALVVDGSESGYLRTVTEYVHLNPARAGLLGCEEALSSYQWSSFAAYLRRPSERPGWLRVDRVLGEMGIPKDSTAGRREFQRLTELRRRQDSPDFDRIRQGWCWGSEEFRGELLERMRQRLGPHHYGEERGESASAWAETLIMEELNRRHLTEHSLAGLPKGHREKVEIAARLRRDTTMTIQWIAERLGMGARQYATQLLYHHRLRQHQP